MNSFDYVRPATVAEAVAAAAAARRGLSRGRHQPARPDEGRRHAARTGSSTSPACPGLDRIEHAAGRRRAHRRAGPQRRPRPRPRLRRAPIPPSPRRCCPAPPPQLRNAATVGGNLLQRTRCAYFYDTASACNKREPGSRLRRAAAARTACTPCSAGASAASPPTRPTSACRWSRSTPWSRSRAARAGARSRSTPSTACPATTPERETVLEPGELIVARPAAGRGRRLRRACALPQGPRAHLLRLRGRLGRRGPAARGRPIAEARIALGGVAAKPWRAREAEAVLAGADARAETPSAAPPRPRSPRPGPPATTPSRSSSRAASSSRALTLAAAGTPDAHARPARLPLRRPARSADPCLRSRSPRRRPTSATAPTSASR